MRSTFYVYDHAQEWYAGNSIGVLEFRSVRAAIAFARKEKFPRYYVMRATFADETDDEQLSAHRMTRNAQVLARPVRLDF